MRLRMLGFAAGVLLLSGCDDIEGLQAISGPTDLPPGTVLTGTWSGEITSTVAPFPLVPGVMQLAQSGASVTGSLTIDNTRGANVTATLSGVRLSGGWTYADLCGGNATFTADLVQGATRLIGTYSSTDCVGGVSGSFTLDRQ